MHEKYNFNIKFKREIYNSLDYLYKKLDFYLLYFIQIYN